MDRPLLRLSFFFHSLISFDVLWTVFRYLPVGDAYSGYNSTRLFAQSLVNGPPTLQYDQGMPRLSEIPFIIVVVLKGVVLTLHLVDAYPSVAPSGFSTPLRSGSIVGLCFQSSTSFGALGA